MGFNGLNDDCVVLVGFGWSWLAWPSLVWRAWLAWLVLIGFANLSGIAEWAGLAEWVGFLVVGWLGRCQHVGVFSIVGCSTV